ncbi:MAG TPA: S1/P1 nuclease [Verrucomicrobiae bacterium]|nr:S1/P1 nuclease [Verrucomicrobiae bacterium]
MKVKRLSRIVVAFTMLMAATLSGRAWDGTGHMLVGQIAYDRLNDKAKARVTELAAQIQKDGVPYNAVNICCWADDIKARDADTPFRGWYRTWHYIDIGCLTNDPDVLANPPELSKTNGNVVVALPYCVNLIKTKQFNKLVPNESVALALVMHFVGDIHQPLHTTGRYNPNPNPPPGEYKDDAGGNGLSLTNFVDTPWPANLHTFWDEAYRRYYEAGTVKASPRLDEALAPGAPELKEWMTRLAPDAPAADADLSFNVMKWVNESHAVACSQVYGTLGAPYGAKNVSLTEAYVKAGTDTARRRIVLAGYRLAALLNDLYGH